MNKQAIKHLLSDNHKTFVDYIDSLTAEEFLLSKNNKWTPGQQLEHIYLSVRPLRQILGFPKFLFRLVWGKANRQGKAYDELVKKYLQKLENGGRATGRFIPKSVSLDRRDKLTNALQKEIVILNHKLDNFTEDELDKYILPHPLLGKLTIREMMYFTIYHVEHHKKLTERDLKQ